MTTKLKKKAGEKGKEIDKEKERMIKREGRRKRQTKKRASE